MFKLKFCLHLNINTELNELVVVAIVVVVVVIEPQLVADCLFCFYFFIRCFINCLSR